MDETTFREPTPAEIQRAVLQFMGENLGELKQLDSHIINRTNTLNGLNLQAESILRSIPAPPVPEVVEQVPLPIPPVVSPVPVPPHPQIILQQQTHEEKQQDNSQLEFNFNPDHYKEIINILKVHTCELASIKDQLRQLNVNTKPPFKKKDH